MYILKRAFCLAALSAIVPISALAAPISIFNTGVNSLGIPLADGAADPHYKNVFGPNGPMTGQSAVLSAANNFPLWVQRPDARWIAPIDAVDQTPHGTYVISTTFDLTGLDPASAQISGFWACDQFGEMRLNGTIVASLPDQNWNGQINPNLNPFTITQFFQPGVNTLSFTVSYPDGFDGLIVSGIHGTANAVPEPTTAAALAFGTIAILRRRNRS